MAGMGETPDKEPLGGARMQARAGAVDNVAADEDDALDQLKRFLSYLPANVWEAPPLARRRRPADRREEELLSIVPRDPRQPYKMRRILEAVLDRGSVFELGAAFGRPTITCLARLGGRPVGVLASDPEHYGGGVTADAAEKTARFVDMCDQFHLPVVNFVDVPGFVIGTDGRARRHDPARRARALRRRPGERALGVDPGAQGLRRGGRRPRRRLAAQPALRLAVGQLGLAADGGRARGRLPARARGGRGPGGAARGDRRAARGGAPRPSARRSASASRRSSTRATRARSCATGPSGRTSWCATSCTGDRRRAARGPDIVAHAIYRRSRTEA